MDDTELNVVHHLLNTSDSDDQPRVHGGSTPGKARNIDGVREEGAIRLHNDYFSNASVYNRKQFLRRFRITAEIFQRLTVQLQSFDSYF